MDCGICSNCGDTYPVPLNMDVTKEHICLNCGKTYIPKIVSMDEFIFFSMKRLKPKENFSEIH